MPTSSRHRTPSQFSGFALIEILVVIGVIGVLVGLLVPAITSVRAAADSADCRNNLRQAYLAFQGYGNDFKGLVAPSAMAFRNRPTVELPWSYFIANYVERAGLEGRVNREIVPSIAICTPFLKRYPDLVDWTSTSVGNIRAWGYLRNPVLAAANGTTTGTTFGIQDAGTYCDPITGAQLTANFRQFRWSQVTQPANRLFIGEGYYESSGQSHAFMVQTGVSVRADNIFYQYTYQWGTTLQSAFGRTIQIGTGIVRSPGATTSDLHRGKRSYLMCDGSARSMTDRYDDANNQVFLSIANPSALR